MAIITRRNTGEKLGLKQNEFKEVSRHERRFLRPLSMALCHAFHTYPMRYYMFPHITDPEERIPFYNLILRNAMDTGVVTTFSQPAKGGAIWLPPHGKTIRPLRAVKLGAYKFPFIFGPISFHRQMKISRYMDKMHERENFADAWYLQAVGIHPDQQGRGNLKVLLTPMLSLFDQLSVSCHLETHSPNNIPLYKAYGFKVMTHHNIPGTSLDEWGMIRPPAGTTSPDKK